MAIFYPSILFVLMFMNSKSTYQSEYRVLTDNCEYWQYQSQFGCQNCSYQCQTCTNFSICTTCLNLNHRQILDNQCNCQQGYFDIINQSTCGQCHSECVDCYGPLRNNCLTCPSPKIKNEYNICYCSSEYYLDQFTNQCECTSKYFYFLLVCNINCLICNGPNSNNCLQCDNTKTLVSNECICYDLKLYNDPLTGQCVQCDPNCNQCNGPNSTDCLSCNFGKFLVGSECKCQSNQYETNEFGFVNCVQCHPSCLTCSSNHQNNCQTCPVNSTLDGQNFCVCDGGYFENNYVCEQCDQTCLLCQYNSKYCTQCNAGEYLLFNQCSCSSSKTDATCSIDCADSLCEKCDRFNGSICYQCVIDASLDSGLCTCPNGLYSQSGVCNVCPSNCVTCNSPTECQSCSDGFYGTHCQSNCPANCIACDSPGDCTSCITGFAGNSCSSSCNAKCVGCSILSVTSCAACHVPLVLHGNVCGCPEHFYGGGCNIACLSSCKTCTGSIGCTVCQDEKTVPPDCLTCIPTPKMNSNCDCEMGYYLAGTHDCQANRTCNGTSSNCYDCYNTTPNQHRDLDNYQCLCQTGYLDTGLDQCVIPTCGNACKECMGTVCSECITANTFRYDLPAQNCPCIDGYYEVFQTAICVKCPNKCSSCTFQSLQTTNICLLCEGSNRILHKGCTCMKGYYDNGDNCEICSIGCSECLNSTTCVICQQNYIYTSGSCYCALINYNTSDCQCLAGYYLDLYTYRCLPCQIQCKTCVLTSSKCLECNQSLPLQIRVNPPKCSCGPTFYEKYLKCESCLSKCQECLDRNTCTSCNSVKILEFSQCKCQQSGYFDSPYPPFICQPCDPKCFECEFSAINCTLCSNNRIYEPICYCPPTYYIHFGDNLCEKCNSKCQECYGFETNCSQCGINRSSPPLCNCSTGYYEDLDEICIKCEPQCVDCQDSPNNCLTCSYLRIEPNLCKCLDGYYETTEKQCLPCHSSCQTCLGPNEYNCLSCDDLKNRSYRQIYFHIFDQ